MDDTLKGAGEFLGSARASRALSGAPPESSEAIKYSKRNLPHFERPWAKYAVAFSTYQRRALSNKERDVVLQSICYGHERLQYELYAACVMPDHVHLLFEPQVKDEGETGESIFWLLTDILRGIKSSTAHRINKLRSETGPVWERESFDRLIRAESDLEEKFSYICATPWNSNVVDPTEDYRGLWTEGVSSARAPKTARGARALPKP